MEAIQSNGTSVLTTERLELADRLDPDPELVRRWLASLTRPVIGWLSLCIGTLAIILGYLGVSREALIAKQLPYLISGGIGGLALMGIGAIFIVSEDVRQDSRRLERLETMVADLRAMLLTASESLTDTELPPTRNGTGPPARAALADETLTSESVLVVPGGRCFHRSGCMLVAKKKTAKTVTASYVVENHLSPCRICEPTVEL